MRRYDTGTVFDRVNAAVATIGFNAIIISTLGVKDAKESTLTESEEARKLLQEILFEIETSEAARDWLVKINARIVELNNLRAKDGRERLPGFEVMLKNVSEKPAPLEPRLNSEANIEQLQFMCGELGSVCNYLQRRIHEDMYNAVLPFKKELGWWKI